MGGNVLHALIEVSEYFQEILRQAAADGVVDSWGIEMILQNVSLSLQDDDNFQGHILYGLHSLLFLLARKLEDLGHELYRDACGCGWDISQLPESQHSEIHRYTSGTVVRWVQGECYVLLASTETETQMYPEGEHDGHTDDDYEGKFECGNQDNHQDENDKRENDNFEERQESSENNSPDNSDIATHKSVADDLSPNANSQCCEDAESGDGCCCFQTSYRTASVNRRASIDEIPCSSSSEGNNSNKKQKFSTPNSWLGCQVHSCNKEDKIYKQCGNKKARIGSSKLSVALATFKEKNAKHKNDETASIECDTGDQVENSVIKQEDGASKQDLENAQNAREGMHIVGSQRHFIKNEMDHDDSCDGVVLEDRLATSVSDGLTQDRSPSGISHVAVKSITSEKKNEDYEGNCDEVVMMEDNESNCDKMSEEAESERDVVNGDSDNERHFSDIVGENDKDLNNKKGESDKDAASEVDGESDREMPIGSGENMESDMNEDKNDRETKVGTVASEDTRPSEGNAVPAVGTVVSEDSLDGDNSCTLIIHEEETSEGVSKEDMSDCVSNSPMSKPSETHEYHDDKQECENREEVYWTMKEQKSQERTPESQGINYGYRSHLQGKKTSAEDDVHHIEYDDDEESDDEDDSSSVTSSSSSSTSSSSSSSSSDDDDRISFKQRVERAAQAAREAEAAAMSSHSSHRGTTSSLDCRTQPQIADLSVLNQETANHIKLPDSCVEESLHSDSAMSSSEGQEHNEEEQENSVALPASSTSQVFITLPSRSISINQHLSCSKAPEVSQSNQESANLQANQGMVTGGTQDHVGIHVVPGMISHSSRDRVDIQVSQRLLSHSSQETADLQASRGMAVHNQDHVEIHATPGMVPHNVPDPPDIQATQRMISHSGRDPADLQAAEGLADLQRGQDLSPTISAESARNAMNCMVTVHQETPFEIRRSAGGKGLECVVCGKVFNRLLKLKQHHRTHTGEKPWACTKCGKRFITAAYLQKHRLTCHTPAHQRQFSCYICHRGFGVQSYLQAHLATHTTNKPFSCDVCGQTFALKFTRDTHKAQHTGNRPWVCSVCGRSYVTKYKLRAHMKAHTGELTCSVCGRQFTSQDSLGRHQRLHDGSNKNQVLPTCHVCNKKFATPSLLKRHIASHERQNALKCNICGQDFVNHQQLTSHQNRHHQSLVSASHRCHVCNKLFVQESDLNRHVATTHDSVTFHPPNNTQTHPSAPSKECESDASNAQMGQGLQALRQPDSGCFLTGKKAVMFPQATTSSQIGNNLSQAACDGGSYLNAGISQAHHMQSGQQLHPIAVGGGRQPEQLIGARNNSAGTPSIQTPVFLSSVPYDSEILGSSLQEGS